MAGEIVAETLGLEPGLLRGKRELQVAPGLESGLLRELYQVLLSLSRGGHQLLLHALHPGEAAVHLGWVRSWPD